MKTCPKCKEQIQDDAKKCKHCKADLRNWFVRHKILTVLLVLIVLAIAGTATRDPKRNTSSKEQAIVAVGEVLNVGDLAYVVDRVEKRTEVGNQYLNEEAAGEFILVHLKIKNNGTKPVTIMTNMFALLDSDKKEYSTTNEAMTAYSIGEKDTQTNFFLDKMQPGLEESGVLIFDVPKDLNGLQLQASDGVWSGSKGLINL